MRLLLVRHAQPDWPEGWSDEDVGLAPQGRLQAASIAREIAQRFAPAGSVAAVLSSPSRRAQETASFIAEAVAQPIALDDSLQGLTRPELRRQLYETGIDGAFLGHATHIQERVWERTQALVEAHEPEANVIAISHDIAIASLVCRALGMPLEDMRRLRVDLASLSIVSFTPRRTLLSLLNETCHLK